MVFFSFALLCFFPPFTFRFLFFFILFVLISSSVGTWQERMEEISVHLEQLRTELKSTLLHRATQGREASQISVKLDQLKKKFTGLSIISRYS